MNTAKNIFNNDIKKNGGYYYNCQKILSNFIAGKIETDQIVFFVKNLQSKNIVDLGCGDGTYTKILLKNCNSIKKILAIDIAEEAIKIAKKKNNSNKLEYISSNIDYFLKNKKKIQKFDTVILRSSLHHFTKKDFLKFFKIIKNFNFNLVISEPNGYNLILKLIEKISKYHVDHDEQSYTPYFLRMNLKKSGYEVIESCYTSLTPVFFPNVLVDLSYKLNKIIKKIPVINSFFCGKYILVAKKKS
jgi:2-polyprenyl-3-methyl-5-hydroxy-6-metoxy-1,4-benzoquinol methylase